MFEKKEYPMTAAIPRTRMTPQLEQSTKDCAAILDLDLAEYVRMALDYVNIMVKAEHRKAAAEKE